MGVINWGKQIMNLGVGCESVSLSEIFLTQVLIIIPEIKHIRAKCERHMYFGGNVFEDQGKSKNVLNFLKCNILIWVTQYFKKNMYWIDVSCWPCFTRPLDQCSRCSSTTNYHYGLHLLTWINFNLSMDKWVHPLWYVKWNYLSIPKLKFWYGWVIPFHTLLDIWLFIHSRINVKPC